MDVKDFSSGMDTPPTFIDNECLYLKSVNSYSRENVVLIYHAITVEFN